MKKIKDVVLILAFLLSFNGCEKNPVEVESMPVNDELTVDQAKAFVDAQRLNQFTLKGGGMQKQTIGIRADWTKSKSSKNEKVSIVETEIQALGRFGFATPESMQASKSTNNEAYLYSMSRLVVMKNKKSGEMVSFIMSIAGDKQYLDSKKFNLWDNTYLKRNKDLSGIVLFHSITGEFVNGWIYCDGQITNSIVANEDLDLPVHLKSIATMLYLYEWVETCTDYYTIGSVDGEVVSIQYTGTNCSTKLVYAGSYDTGSSSGTPESTSGGAPGGYTPPPTQPCNCTDTCPFCGKCLNSSLKMAVLPGDGTTTTPTSDPCEYCSCPPKNPIPSISSLSTNFRVVAGMSASEVYNLIGGNVLYNHNLDPAKYNNACALRLSYALNMIPGHNIPFIEGVTVSGDVNRDGKKEWYFLTVSAIVDYLNSIYGSCTATNTINIQGMTGIIWQSDCGWGEDATGHVDVWEDSNALGHYYDACTNLYIWRN